MDQFNQPQRQSKIGIIVLFVDTLQKNARALLPLLFIWLIKSEKINSVYLIIGILLTIAIAGIIAYLRYVNFTFYIDNEREEFIVKDGIFNKTKTTIHLSKIQQVNINQNLIQRLIKVYSLDVDTAGSDKKEGNIKAISHELALSLKSKLLENEAAEISEIISDSVPEINVRKNNFEMPFLKIDMLSLLKIGITSNYVKTIGLLLTFFVTIYDNLNQVGKTDVISSDNVNQFLDSKPMFFVIIMFVLFLFTVVFLLNIGRTVIKFFGYTISKQKGSLVLSYGLINTKSTLLKPAKVQITKVSMNFFQRKLNVLEIKIKQAVGADEEKNKNIIEIPGCSLLEADEILKLLFNELPQKDEMLRPNFRKLVFSIFLLIIVPLTVFMIVGWWINQVVFEYSFGMLFYGLFILILLVFGFKNYKLFISEKYIFKQSGAWDVDNEIIQIEKIQALTTSQLFWHKNLNIGSLTLHTAGGNITFQLGKFDRINQLVNLWLYKLETSNSNWM